MSDKHPWPLPLKGSIVGGVIGGVLGGFHAAIFRGSLSLYTAEDLPAMGIGILAGGIVGAGLGAWIGARTGVRGQARGHHEHKHIEPPAGEAKPPAR
jgi:hypothetical protein